MPTNNELQESEWAKNPSYRLHPKARKGANHLSERFGYEQGDRYGAQNAPRELRSSFPRYLVQVEEDLSERNTNSLAPLRADKSGETQKRFNQQQAAGDIERT